MWTQIPILDVQASDEGQISNPGIILTAKRYDISYIKGFHTYGETDRTSHLFIWIQKR